MRTRMRALTFACTAAAWSCAAVVLGQQPQVRCGPAAAIITTPRQQQSLVASLRPRRALRWTTKTHAGVPYVTYENGHEYRLMPEEYVMKAWRGESGSGGKTKAPRPDSGGHRKQAGTPQRKVAVGTPVVDPPEVAALTAADLPWSLFTHAGTHLTPVKSQGGRGLCHVFGATAMVESLVKKHLMARGVPAPLAEVDLSEAWMAFEVLKNRAGGVAGATLPDDGGWPSYTFNVLETTGFLMESYWPYNPICWPKESAALYPCAAPFAQSKTASWECWAQRDVGQNPPASVQQSKGLVSPAGPLPNIRTRDTVGDSGLSGLELAKENIKRGRTVALTVYWPKGGRMDNGLVLYVPEGFPLDLWARKAAPDIELTDDEVAQWYTWFEGGHAVQLFGYGKTGTVAEGLWLIKNSHGLDSGQDGILCATTNFLLASFPGITAADLADITVADLDRFADTMKR